MLMHVLHITQIQLHLTADDFVRRQDARAKEHREKFEEVQRSCKIGLRNRILTVIDRLGHRRCACSWTSAMRLRTHSLQRSRLFFEPTNAVFVAKNSHTRASLARTIQKAKCTQRSSASMGMRPTMISRASLSLHVCTCLGA